MNLAWLQYQHGTKSEYYLVLVLSEEVDRYCGLLNKEISDIEAELIRRNLPQLEKMTPGEVVGWFRSSIPNYNKAYREFRKDRTRLDKTFNIKPLEVK